MKAVPSFTPIFPKITMFPEFFQVFQIFRLKAFPSFLLFAVIFPEIAIFSRTLPNFSDSYTEGSSKFYSEFFWVYFQEIFHVFQNFPKPLFFIALRCFSEFSYEIFPLFSKVFKIFPKFSRVIFHWIFSYFPKCLGSYLIDSCCIY